MYTYLKTASTYIFCVCACVCVCVCVCAVQMILQVTYPKFRELYKHMHFFVCVCVWCTRTLTTFIDQIYTHTYLCVRVCLCVSVWCKQYCELIFEICATLYTIAFLCVCVYTYTHINRLIHTDYRYICTHNKHTHIYIYMKNSFMFFIKTHFKYSCL
jgi:hypothetical protein